MYDGNGPGNNLVNFVTGQFGHFNYRIFRKRNMWPLLRDHGAINPNFYYIFEDRRAIYLMLPKVACTAILTTIGKSYGITAQDISSDPSSHHLKIFGDRRWNTRWGKLEDAHRGYDIFTFVRNPFDRIVSCYRDKIVYSDPGQFFYYSNYFFDLPANISFAEFVQSISAIPDRLADRHFKSQVSSVFENGKPLANQIGRFENLREDWRKITNQYHFDPELTHYNDSKIKKGVLHDFRAYYDKRLVELVYRRYKQDVELLGYRQAYEELLDYV